MIRKTAFYSLILKFALVVGSVESFADPSAVQEKPIKVMLLTGQMNQYHSWQVCSSVIRRHLEESGRFQVDRVVSPPRGQDMSGFSPEWANYEAVVVDYDGDCWSESARSSFESYVREGGGLVVCHSSDNAFPDWPDWNLMIGIGGWGGRGETAGPMLRWRDGRVVRDYGPGTSTHPPKHDFQIIVRDENHPITRGMPQRWMHAFDELYSRLRGPALNVHVLATAKAAPEIPNATGEHEPILMTIDYGKGRVFHMTLGHVGIADQEPLKQLNCVGYILSLQRGTEWAATGKVTLPIPDDFPSANRTSVRGF